MISDYKSQIDTALADFFKSPETDLGLDLSAQVKAAFKNLQDYSTRPGKRIRGSLAALAYDTQGSTKFGAPGIQLAVALELMQNYLLIVDDVMDKSTTRRGKPTVHYLYKATLDKAADMHEPNMFAINVGLIAQHLANKVVLESGEKPDNILRSMKLMHKNIMATGLGQIDDLYQQIEREVSENDIIRKYRLKSSYYTFVNPLQSGVTLAGNQNPQLLLDIENFGEPVGIAFQLHDDFLGVFGEVNTTGKSNLDDIREGKYTLLMHYALNNANQSDKDHLKAILGKTSANDADLKTVQNILETSGAKQFVMGKISAYVEQSKQALSSSKTIPPELAQILNEIVNYSVSRQS